MVVFMLLFCTCLVPVYAETFERTRPSDKTVVVTTILTKPFTMLKVNSDMSEDNDRLEMEGYAIDLIKLLAERVGFNYRIQLVKDGTFGSVSSNGNWSGMIGELLNEEADIAVAPLTINRARARVVDFSKPFMTTGLAMLAKKPDRQVFGICTIFKPFNDRLWIAILFVFVVCSVIFCIIGRLSPYEDTLSNGSMTVTLLPRSLSGRIASLAWWFFIFVMVSVYTAALIQSPTFAETTKLPITSVEDLANQKKVGRHSSCQRIKGLYLLFIVRLQQKTVFQGRYIFILEETAAAYANSRKPCDTVQVGGKLATRHYGIATPFGSDLKNSIDLAILEMEERGELKRLENKWWYDRGVCPDDDTESFQSHNGLGISRVVGVFYLLFGAMLLALIVAGLERVCSILFNKCKKNRLEENGSSSHEANEKLLT